MDDRPTRADESRGGLAGEHRLESWKRIAAYLKRDVTTVQRWERREAMPVHRHLHEKLGSVYAYRSELDAWWGRRGSRLAADDAVERSPPTVPDLSGDGSPILGGQAVRALAVILGGLLIIGVWAWRTHDAGRSRDPLASANVRRLTLTGTERAAALSRDGRFVAYLAGAGGVMDAWLTEIGSNRYRNLTNGRIPELSNPAIRTLSFSPDGSRVVIWTRSADGSRPEDIQLVDAPTDGGPLQPYLREAAEIDWSADGRQLVYHTTAPGDPLFVRAAGDETAHQIYVAPPGIHCHFPTWSPDGQFIYFVRGEPPDHWDVWRLRPNGEAPERMTFHNARVTYPVWLDSRTLSYLATDPDGSGPWLYSLDVVMRSARRGSADLERYTSLAASANGMHLAATIANSHSDLWRVAIGGDGPPQTVATPVVPAFPNSFAPRFGPGYLAYESSSRGRRGVWKLANDTVTEIWSAVGADRVGVPAVAPDGRRIAFTVTRHNATQLCVVDSEGRHARVIPFPDVRGDLSWAPDAEAVIAAIVRNGEPRLARIFLDGRPPQAIASEYSVNPVWSTDGKFLVYSGADVGTTFPIRAAGPDGRPYGMASLILTRGAGRVAFARNSGSLVILRGEIGHKNFWLWNPQTGAERQLTRLPANVTVGDFDVSPDGTEVIFERVHESSSIALIDRVS